MKTCRKRAAKRVVLWSLVFFLPLHIGVVVQALVIFQVFLFRGLQ